MGPAIVPPPGRMPGDDGGTPQGGCMNQIVLGLVVIAVLAAGVWLLVR